MNLGDIHRLIKDSDYKTWQIYLLAISLIVCVGLYYDLGPVTDLLKSFEGTATGIQWIVILAIQGVLIGFAAEFVYEQGDRYAKTGDSTDFGSKDKILLARVGMMTVISATVTILAPSMIRSLAEYFVIQTAGATILLGIVLVHLGSSKWNPSTEWPALLAGGLLALAPSIL